METNKKCCCRGNRKAAETYPGVATDIADNDKVNADLVKQETSMMNNNHHGQ